MEKRIFIPHNVVPQWVKSALNVPIKESIDYLYWLGLVNQQLGDKANCKEIVRVSHCQESTTDGARIYIGSLGIWEGFTEGYLVTYLESEMIATKNDLENAWNVGYEEGQEFEKAGGMSYQNLRPSTYFHEWFDENFPEKTK